MPASLLACLTRGPFRSDEYSIQTNHNPSYLRQDPRQEGKIEGVPNWVNALAGTAPCPPAACQSYLVPSGRHLYDSHAPFHSHLQP
ncbi:hypothetical protein EI94DRAFT_1730040 [Lactarius quietus]|nr:hypothetical protein EI94DRAFT_1730040 [Lactarius quietus]